MAVNLVQEDFIIEYKGKKTGLYFIENEQGLKIALTNYGARVVSIKVPDKNGKSTDVVLGFKTIKEYIEATDQSYGAIVGRFAGRIAAGRFKIDDHT